MSHSFSKRILRSFLLFMFLTAAVMLLPILLPKTHAAQAKIRLNKTSIHMVPGYTLKLKVKGTEAPVTWRSRKKSVATVDENGVVTGKKPGSCKIIARAGGKKLTCKVRVYNPGSVVNTEGAMHGIDVSIWQGNINFNKVKKDGIDFVIMRAGHGTSVDTKFKRNYKKARKAGLKVGCYWFVTSTSISSLNKQIRMCKKAIKGKKFDMPVFIDIESNSQFSRGKDFCSSLVTGFCDKMLKAGYTTGWYTSRSFVPKYLHNSVSRNKDYVAWIAEHDSKLRYSYKYDIWQYSHTGRVKGISAYVDLNWYFPNARKAKEQVKDPAKAE